MRLVKGGRVIEDPYLRVADDAAVPDDVPVLLPAGSVTVQTPPTVLEHVIALTSGEPVLSE